MSQWYAVDLDATLAEYNGWNGGKIGRPIPAMVERVKRWRAKGKEVRIFTARVGTYEGISPEVRAMIDEQRQIIAAWCLEHIGEVLPVTATKDFGMIELWDDRAVTVEPNTGRVLTQGRGASGGVE